MQPRLVCLCVLGVLATGWLGAATVAVAADPVVVAAGDIACSPTNPAYSAGTGTAAACGQMRTSNLIGSATAVLPVGDVQYEAAAAGDLQASYAPSWGRYMSISHPVPGNHEYLSGSASDYFSYFGSRAGTAGKGWYSFDLGSWHIIAINSECDHIAGGCAAGGEQEQWLRADLAAHQSACIMAFWHEPRFSSGPWVVTNAEAMAPIWDDVYAAGADVVISGHRHFYERFAPLNRTGGVDATRGIQSFVVGTGGNSHEADPAPILGSMVHNASTFGVLQLTLHASSYDWQFVPEAGRPFTDSGTGQCHALNAPPPAPTPAVPPPAPTPAVPPPAPTPAVPPSPAPAPVSPTQTPPPVGAAARGPSRVRVARATIGRGRRTIAVRGTIVSGATGPVLVTVKVRIGGRTRFFRRRARVGDGTFTAEVRLPTARWRSLRVRTRYGGDAAYLPGSDARTVRGAR